MKFLKEPWLQGKPPFVKGARNVADIRIEQDKVTVYASINTASSRAQTLNNPLITFEYTAPLPDIICVRIVRYAGGVNNNPEFSLNKDPSHRPGIQKADNEIVFTSGGLCARIATNGDHRVVYEDRGRRITASGNRQTAWIEGENGITYLRERLELDIGECVYGLGERFTPFVKNGQSVDMWNTDNGTGSWAAYKNVPFYITNRGYGVFVNDPGRVSFEIGSDSVENVQFGVSGDCLEYYIIGGGAMKAVLDNYTNLTGRPSLPPAWSFGLWLTTSFVTSYDENTVTSFIDGMKERGIPLSVFHFDCFWMKEYQWCDFCWDPDVFPDPAGMLARLKSKGLKICVWINPYIAQKSPLFAEGMQNGYFIKDKNGNPWQCDWWQSGMAFVDFTNPAAARWYQEKLRVLLSMGVDCFKTDFGEIVPFENVHYYSGADPEKMRNYYTFMYNKTVYELLKDMRGPQDALVFARSATAGSQQFPVHWGGDSTACYASMAETLRGGLSFGLSGFGFWSHDISGFNSTATPDLYKRWTAFGLLSSHSRLHGEESYRVPWLFDEESVDVLRFFTKLKCSLMPYLYHTACEAADHGLPVLRAMALEFDSDPACDYLDRQFMLGESLLVAPIFNDRGAVSYYLPAGEWYHFLTGEKIHGGSWRNETHSYFSLPLLVRPGRIIPAGDMDNRPDYDYLSGVTFHVFDIDDKQPAYCTVENPDRTAIMTLEACYNNGIYTFTASGLPANWRVLLRGGQKALSVNGGHAEPDKNGIRIIPDKNAAKVVVTCGM